MDIILPTEKEIGYFGTRDWYDDYIEDAPKMKFYLISDTHLKHANMKTYCDRPENFTELIIRNCKQIIRPEDTLIHLGDVAIGKLDDWAGLIYEIPGRKILIRGNHDRNRSNSWWMDNGFTFACDGMRFRGCWLTHEPYDGPLPAGTNLNIHGHLHNIWHGFKPNGGGDNPQWSETGLQFPWQRLFAVEYTNYMPVEFDKFVAHPDKYLARGLNGN